MVDYKKFKEDLKTFNQDTYYRFLDAAREYDLCTRRLSGPEVGKRKSDIQDLLIGSYTRLEKIVKEINCSGVVSVPSHPEILRMFVDGFVNYTKGEVIIEQRLGCILTSARKA